MSRGGFSLSDIPMPMSKRVDVSYNVPMVGRGGFAPGHTPTGVGYKPPDDKTETKSKKTKHGTLKIKSEAKISTDPIDAEADYDENYLLNWEKLEDKKLHKYKPCVRMLKKLSKNKKPKPVKKANLKLGDLYFGH